MPSSEGVTCPQSIGSTVLSWITISTLASKSHSPGAAVDSSAGSVVSPAELDDDPSVLPPEVSAPDEPGIVAEAVIVVDVDDSVLVPSVPGPPSPSSPQPMTRITHAR